jgi:hypothetical protein
VTQTTCVNDELAKEMKNRNKSDDQVMGTKKSAINLHRVDSHLLALRKKKPQRLQKGAPTRVVGVS